ncbi:MAG TPA: hypothetical protein VLT33_48380, partial [Labilithrix sp.]|nr:hypothetical protein [Labilithrix sp.]
QQRDAPADATATYSLDADLRPAIARISARMARLAVRVPRGTERAAVIAEARAALAGTGLASEPIDRLGAALAALAAP